jgi:hypothetical protein
MDIGTLNESWSDSDDEEHIDASARENQQSALPDVSTVAQMDISVKIALDHPPNVENVVCSPLAAFEWRVGALVVAFFIQIDFLIAMLDKVEVYNQQKSCCEPYSEVKGTIHLPVPNSNDWHENNW